MNKVRKFLIAQTQAELLATLDAHLAHGWEKVGGVALTETRRLGDGRLQQVIEKEMPDRLSRANVPIVRE